jgi:hypothetical protein
MTDLNLIIIGTKKQLQQRPPPPPPPEPVWFYEDYEDEFDYWDWEDIDLFYREFYGEESNFFSSYPDFEEDFD